MMVSMETYLRRGQRTLERWLLEPRLRRALGGAGWWLGGFLFSAAALGAYPVPLAMGLICGAKGWQAVALGLGAMAGYPVFWGAGAGQGLVWSAVGTLLAVLLGSRQESRDMPLMVPALASAFTGVTGVTFLLFLGERAPFVVFAIRVALAGLSAALFTQVLRQRDAFADWMAAGLGVLALAQVMPLPWVNLGTVAAGMLVVAGAFPAAALAGLGLDLAQITRLPMTAVLCLGYFLGMVPYGQKWQKYAAPAFGCLLVMGAWQLWDWMPLPGLALGGGLGALLPKRPDLARRRGDTGVAQVRLELGAQVLGSVGRMLFQQETPPIDLEALLEKARHRACGTCSARQTCLYQAQLTAELLENPLDADCRKSGRLIPELRRAQDQLRLLQGDRLRRQEYRRAIYQQYGFFSDYLRGLSDQLARRQENRHPLFRVEVSSRSRGKAPANGDQCLAFSGPGCRFFLLLCDGMGTGLGAAQSGHRAAGLLRQMLSGGFPPRHALGTLNSLLALEGQAGEVTVDLAEIRLDTGIGRIYKWGAAPSWLLHRSGAEKIGTATPPPGLSLESQEKTEKLSLRRGEVLILLSDGVDGEDALRRCMLPPDAPPGELAAEILERGCRMPEDDATAVVLRLRPVNLSAS